MRAMLRYQTQDLAYNQLFFQVVAQAVELSTQYEDRSALQDVLRQVVAWAGSKFPLLACLVLERAAGLALEASQLDDAQALMAQCEAIAHAHAFADERRRAMKNLDVIADRVQEEVDLVEKLQVLLRSMSFG